PFTLASYIGRTLSLLRTLLFSTRMRRGPLTPADLPDLQPATIATVVARMTYLLRIGALSSIAAISETLGLLAAVTRALPLFPERLVGALIGSVVTAIRARLEDLVATEEGLIYRWEVIDLMLAFLTGAVRWRLMIDRRGLSAIDEYDWRDWLRQNGASERSLDSCFVRGMYDLPMAYENGDPARPGLAAGQAIRTLLRMFFTYRGALFWKMRSGMGDVIFAPYYEVLKRRGVRFEFFHRLENVRLAPEDSLVHGEKRYVEALEFDVQATIKGGGDYQPLIDVKGVPCWPAEPDYAQLVDGTRLRREGRRFESFWDRRRVRSKTLRVGEDFDFVVLGVGIGAIPHVCQEILASNQRWRDMVTHVRTVATQAFQVWLTEDMAALGWNEPPVTLSAFVKPFDTWADMTHLVPEEAWTTPPKAVAYFCNVLADPPDTPARDDATYEAAAREEVRRNAIDFLNTHARHLWPYAVTEPGRFRWELLAHEANDKAMPQGEARFDTQYWTANINPSDRYVLMLPGSMRYRISPLDNTYDNLTIAGDWTDNGFNAGCVEGAVISGRLAAHAISLWPPLEDIAGYDHP
ncbi:MAG: FAD-dependent oxidoreductase, partial [Proteobacteria bacterium]|nr:FAD-dependent oxidoreductase [Pseudomonadota bacterium]